MWKFWRCCFISPQTGYFLSAGTFAISLGQMFFLQNSEDIRIPLACGSVARIVEATSSSAVQVCVSRMRRLSFMRRLRSIVVKAFRFDDNDWIFLSQRMICVMKKYVIDHNNLKGKDIPGGICMSGNIVRLSVP